MSGGPEGDGAQRDSRQAKAVLWVMEMVRTVHSHFLCWYH